MQSSQAVTAFHLNRPSLSWTAALIVLLLFLIGPLPVGFSAAAREVEPDCVDAQPDVTHPPTILVLFSINNGRTRKTFYSATDLRVDPEIRIDGYVAGIVVLSEADNDIYFDGKRMREVARQRDGSLSFNYFGRLDPEKIFDFDVPDRRNPNRFPAHVLDGAFQGYSFFPKITGEPVSGTDRFKIDIPNEDGRLTVAVHQTGYRDLPQDNTPSTVNRPYRLRYIGDRLHDLDPGIRDNEARLRSIADGIAEVEKAFRVHLVQNIQFIDCDGIHNALTRAGYQDLWFFTEAFRNESISELKVIARHETLHLLVDRYDFTRVPAIREIFRDLKRGEVFTADDSSYSLSKAFDRRNQVLTSGPDFFSFINEKNFFRGSKGGHAHDNLNEFCTSFLHSLLYPEKIGENLDLPAAINGNQAPSILSADEKKEILALYSRLIAAFSESIDRQDADLMGTFLETRSEYVRNLADDFWPVRNTYLSR
ncbi:MAG: hypothetical protein WAK95_17940 [Desulfobacterales bacterium]